MYKNIIFFNHFHNGDIHVSRGIISKIIERVNKQYPEISFSYSHPNASDLLADIPNLKFDPSGINIIKNPHDNFVIIRDTVYINTWYAQQQYKYMNQYGLTIDCLYAALNDSCEKLWGFSLSEISSDLSTFFPTIDYSKFKIDTAKMWLDQHPEKKIFVANGAGLSGQSTNFAMTPIISQLALRHKDKTFILTSKEGETNLPNIVYSTDIIQKGSSDLNENSFISSFCDVIIGRSSGPSTFAMTQENLFKRPVKILYFTNIVPVPPNKFWASEILRDTINYAAEIICTNDSDENQVYNIINSKLNFI